MRGGRKSAGGAEVERVARLMQGYARARGQLFDWRGMAAAVLESLGSESPATGPKFAVVEGIDRCGKSVQAERLVARLRSAGVEAELFSTPEYCSALAPLVRAQLSGTARLTCALTGQESHLDALSLECTFVCDRYAVAHQIREALARGVSAVCVRWWQSALLYGKEDEVDLGLVEAACSSLPEPDLNILLDADAGRVSHRLDSANRYESDLPRQERLALAYRDLWTRTGAPRTLGGSGRWEVVLGDGTLDEVSGKICEAAAATWPSLKKI